MRFYIASNFNNALAVRKLATELRGDGHKHTYDWTTHTKEDEDSISKIADIATAEMYGVKTANVVIVLLPGGRGTHCELGAANAVGTPVIIWGKDEDAYIQDGMRCPFYYNDNVVARITGDVSQIADVVRRLGAV